MKSFELLSLVTLCESKVLIWTTVSGAHPTESAKRRQKEQYRVDLEQQMREAADGRRRYCVYRLSVWLLLTMLVQKRELVDLC